MDVYLESDLNWVRLAPGEFQRALQRGRFEAYVIEWRVACDVY